MPMKGFGRALIFWLYGVLSGSVMADAQTPVEAIKSYSDFKQIDLNRLLAGDILSERGSLMYFPNGISAQTCFAVTLSAEETTKRLQVWDPAPHDDLKVHAFHSLRVPSEPADFQQLDFKSNQHSIRWLLEKSAAATSSKSELNLTREEAEALASCMQKRPDPQKGAECWTKLLLDRASLFQQKGLAGVPPYEVAGDTVSPVVQLRTMLLEQADVAREFLPLLKKIGLLGDTIDTTLLPFYYWTFLDADHHGTLSLGAVYQLQIGDHYQLADVQYYVSNSYYTAVTLYEIWPIQAGARTGALVWRGDYFTAPMLAFTKGTERIAYGALMLQDIKKGIRFFKEDLRAKP